MKTAIVNASTLGTNCWTARRFCGGECPRLEECKYPEKVDCQAHIQKNKRIVVKRKLMANGQLIEDGMEEDNGS